MTKTNQRKTIEVARKRVPLRKLLHGKEIRAAAKALEDFRMNLNEAEFLYGAKITLMMDPSFGGDCVAVAKRLETDREFADRMERARLAAEAKKAREAKRRAEEEKRAIEQAFYRRAKAVEYIRNVAKEAGISSDELVDILVK
jgi:hypothetical protein